MKSICLYCNKNTVDKYKRHSATDKVIVKIYFCKRCNVNYNWRLIDGAWTITCFYFDINNMTMRFELPMLIATLYEDKWEGDTTLSYSPMTLERITLMTIPANNLIYLPLDKLKRKMSNLMAFM